MPYALGLCVFFSSLTSCLVIFRLLRITRFCSGTHTRSIVVYLLKICFLLVFFVFNLCVFFSVLYKFSNLEYTENITWYLIDGKRTANQKQSQFCVHKLLIWITACALHIDSEKQKKNWLHANFIIYISLLLGYGRLLLPPSRKKKQPIFFRVLCYCYCCCCCRCLYSARDHRYAESFLLLALLYLTNLIVYILFALTLINYLSTSRFRLIDSSPARFISEHDTKTSNNNNNNKNNRIEKLKE